MALLLPSCFAPHDVPSIPRRLCSMPFESHKGLFWRYNECSKERFRHLHYSLISPKHLSVSMLTGSCISCTFGSVPLGLCSYPSTSCLGEESAIKCKGGCCPREKYSRVLTWDDPPQFFFCLAMDPIFVALNQIPRVLLVAGYVDDTTIVGTQQDPEWIKEVFRLVNTWSAAGVVMDAHTCWQVGLSRIPLPEQQLLRCADYAETFIPWHAQGEATISAAVRHIPHYAHYFVLRHGEHCAIFHATQRHEWMHNGHPLLLQLAASPCDCRSKTQLLTSAAFSAVQIVSC